MTCKTSRYPTCISRYSPCIQYILARPPKPSSLNITKSPTYVICNLGPSRRLKTCYYHSTHLHHTLYHEITSFHVVHRRRFGSPVSSTESTFLTSTAQLRIILHGKGRLGMLLIPSQKTTPPRVPSLSRNKSSKSSPPESRFTFENQISDPWLNPIDSES